jgi:hypothetical protein
MTFRRSIRAAIAVALFALAQLGFASGAPAAGLPACKSDDADSPVDSPEFCHTVDPHDTDPQILDTPTPPGPRGDHLVFLGPKESRVGRLLVFLPTGGVNNKPSEFSHLGTEARRLGYHTILLAYRNEAPIAAPITPVPPALPGCGPLELPTPSAPDCAIKIRMELLKGDEGDGGSPLVDVDRANSIENRLNKLLQYLAANHADDGWAKFLDTNGEPKWSATVIAGSSLGAGQAAIIAEQHEVYRAALLHGWVDARHGWVKRVATPSNRYFTLIHQRENFFGRTCYAYLELGLAPSCPLPDFAVLPAQSCPAAAFPVVPANPLWIESRQPPFGTPLHVFSLKPGSFQGAGDHCHQSTSRDDWTAKEEDNGVTPSHHLVNAWRSVLGDSDADTRLDEADNCQQDPNTDQTDSDRDGSGNACDLTPLGTPPTIVTPEHITVDATAPAGVVVAYAVTATDDVDADPTVNCVPPSGSVFAIGDRLVACDSTDSLGNASSASFLVTVLGAKEQLANLIRKVVDSTRLPATVKTQLIASLQSLVAGFDPSNPLQRKVACLRLKVFTSVVRYLAPPAVAAEWTADANRIRAVLGC